MGRWYEFYRSVPELYTGECTTASYVKLPNNYVQVNNILWDIEKQEFKSGGDNGETTFPGRAQCSTFTSGKCQVEFGPIPWGDYGVINTDYDSYTVIYGCDNFGAAAYRTNWLWVLSRVPMAIGTAAHTAFKELVDNEVNKALEDPVGLRQTQQTLAEGCVYSKYPLEYKGRANNIAKYETPGG